MSKKNYIKYIETDSFPNVLKPNVSGTHPIRLDKTFPLDYFKNANAVTAEFGCGRGEYTLSLARANPHRNFIGMDIKTSRMWHGAKQALEEKLENVLFVKLKIELIEAFFPKNSLSEIWIPFPEPRISKLNGRKCLTSVRFLEMYRILLKNNGLIHIKTDDSALYEFSVENASECRVQFIRKIEDLYNTDCTESYLTDIQTRYEKRYLAELKTIKYLQFSFDRR